MTNPTARKFGYPHNLVAKTASWLEGERTFESFTFTDHGWPGAPQLSPAVDLAPAVAAALVERLRPLWPAA